MSTWTPKVGMKVRCIRTSETGRIVEGKVYEVNRVWEASDGRTHPAVADKHDPSAGWCCEFFEPVSEPSAEDPYASLGAEIGRLVTEKNKAYGSSFQKSGDIMRILYPEGISPEKMDDALTIVRILDKLFRIATDKDAFGESPFKDLVGYGLLGAVKASKK